MFFKANKSMLYGVLGVALASTSAAAMADVLVTRSSGAIAREFPRGSRIGDDQLIRLRAGDSVTVLTGSGTRQYNRPGRYRMSGPTQVASNGITGGSRNGMARTGVTRGDPTASTTAAMIRSVWQIDVNQSGAFCVAEGQPVSLWRTNATASTELTVTRVTDGESMKLNIDAGQYAYNWPETFAATAGTYMIETTGSPAHAHINMIPINVDLSDRIAVGSSLLTNECDGQLEAMTADYELVAPTGG